MIFNPQESIDFHGFTGPFVQYTHARICSILRKAEEFDNSAVYSGTFTDSEKQLLQLIDQYPAILIQASNEYNPSVVCNFVYLLAKTYNAFLVDHSVLKAETNDIKTMRLQLSSIVRQVIEHALQLFGIHSPHRM